MKTNYSLSLDLDRLEKELLVWRGTQIPLYIRAQKISVDSILEGIHAYQSYS